MLVLHILWVLIRLILAIELFIIFVIVVFASRFVPTLRPPADWLLRQIKRLGAA